MDLGILRNILFGRPLPARVREGLDDLYDEGKPMGIPIVGRQGSGKTSFLCRTIVDDFLRNPRKSFFIFDSGGSDKQGILTLLAQQDKDVFENSLKRVVVDVAGHPDLVIPLPEFSEKYGSFEEQVQRVSQNFVKLSPHLVTNAPFLGGLSLREIAPQIFRVCCAISNEYGENWQITEAKKLLLDQGLLRRALNKFGGQIPEAKYFLERIYLELDNKEKELRTFSLLALLGVFEPREIRARVGYYRPAWTPQEIIDDGKMLILDMSRLINQKNAQHYLFTQAYSLVMQEINRRIPGDPEDEPVALVMDEVYSLLSIPGMAEEVGMLSPLYRSRGLEPYVVLQSLSQLAPPLDKQIWSMGNKVVFAIENKEEAEEIAKQLFKYDPRYLKQPARHPNQNFITEPEAGQDRIIADWIQNLNFRECLMRRFVSEREVEPLVVHVPQTRPLPSRPPIMSVREIEEMKLREIGIPIRDALEVINQRKIESDRKAPPSV